MKEYMFKVFGSALVLMTVVGCSNKESNPSPANTVFIKKTYYDSGKLRTYAEYNAKEDTLINGLSVQFYENGNILQEGVFKDGKAEGVFYNYYENTNVKSELNYIAGVNQGTAVFYYQTDKGSLVNQGNVSFDDQGKIIKPEPESYVKGQVSDSLNLVNGKILASRTMYNENGNLKRYFFYDEYGTLTYKRLYNSSGEFKSHFGFLFTDLIVEKNTFNVGDTVNINLYIATPPEQDCKLYYYETGENKSDIITEKHEVELVNNKYTYQKVFQSKDLVRVHFELETGSTNPNDRTREIKEIIFRPNGLSPMKVVRDSIAQQEVMSQQKG